MKEQGKKEDQRTKRRVVVEGEEGIVKEFGHYLLNRKGPLKSCKQTDVHSTKISEAASG